MTLTVRNSESESAGINVMPPPWNYAPGDRGRLIDVALTQREPENAGVGERENAPSGLKLRLEYGTVRIIVVKPPDTVYGPGDVGRFKDLLPSGGGVTYASRDPDTSDPPSPYRMKGDVDIECAPITGNDVSFAALMLMDANVAQASIRTESGANGVRGPPSGVRTIYVEGKVNSFKLPDQFDESRLKGKVIDLGPNEDYKRQVKVFQEQVKQLEKEHSVTFEELKAYAGHEVRVADGKVVEANGKAVKNADGKVVPPEEHVNESNRPENRVPHEGAHPTRVPRGH